MNTGTSDPLPGTGAAAPLPAGNVPKHACSFTAPFGEWHPLPTLLQLTPGVTFDPALSFHHPQERA